MDAVQEVVDFPFYNLKNPLKVYIKYHFNIVSLISSRVSFNLAMNATIKVNNISMLGFFSYLVLQVGWSLSQLSHGDMYVFVLWGWGAGVPWESPRRHRENMQALCRLYAGGGRWLVDWNPTSSCCEAAARTTAPLCPPLTIYDI